MRCGRCGEEYCDEACVTSFTVNLTPEFLKELRARLVVKSISGNGASFMDQFAARIVELIDEGKSEWTPRLVNRVD